MKSDDNVNRDRDDDMPSKPKIPCGHQGCPELVEPAEKYCAAHKRDHPKEARSAYARGYGKKWQQASKAYLAAHPLCVRCKNAGRYTKAEVVDHIIPHRGDKVLFWDKSNWQSLCKCCHDKKTFNEDKVQMYHY